MHPGGTHMSFVPPVRSLGARVLPILVVVDVDPDWRALDGSGVPYTGGVSWRGLRVGIPRLLELTKDLRDEFGQPIRFTWLLRADEQMAALCDDTAFVATAFESFWRERLAAGDEVGWHPQLWRYSERHRLWYQETRDVDWMASCLRDGHAALARHFRIHAAKSGWTFHTNDTVRIFEELGVVADLSALPGMSYAGAIPRSDLPLGCFDWERSPQEPYRPNPTDYQRPAGRRGRSIVEIPNWTFPTGRVLNIRRAMMGRPPRDFANLAKHSSLVSEAFGRPPWSVPFVCYFHPEELLGFSHLFSVEHAVRNLNLLFATCRTRGLYARSTTPSELIQSN